MSVVINSQSGIQIRIITQHGFDELRTEMIIQEQSIVRLKEDISTVLFVGGKSCVTYQISLSKYGLTHLTVTSTPCHKTRTQGVDRLGSHTIQTDTFLEGLCVILTSRIQHRNSIHQTSQRNTTTIVTHGNTQVILHLDINALSRSHFKFVDTVVHHLLQQDIDSVFSL